MIDGRWNFLIAWLFEQTRQIISAIMTTNQWSHILYVPGMWSMAINSYPCSVVRFSNKCRESLRWRHNERASVSNHQSHHCLLDRLFRRRSKKSSKLRVTGLCAGNSPGPVNSPHKWPVTRKMFPFDDVIMYQYVLSYFASNIFLTRDNFFVSIHSLGYYSKHFVVTRDVYWFYYIHENYIIW